MTTDRSNQALKDLTADGKGAEAPSRVLDRLRGRHAETRRSITERCDAEPVGAHGAAFEDVWIEAASLAEPPDQALERIRRAL
jgi:hypothetical protein